MGQLVHYTREQKIQAATHYAINGSYAKLQRDMDIPKTTAHGWSSRGDTLRLETIEQLRTENQERHVSQYHALTEKALRAADKGIDKLDTDKLTAGDIRSLVITGAASTDKALLLQGKATSISGKSGADSMEQMRKKFELIEDQYQAQKAILNGTVIASQDESKGPIE